MWSQIEDYRYNFNIYTILAQFHTLKQCQIILYFSVVALIIQNETNNLWFSIAHNHGLNKNNENKGFLI